jgi:alginate O-acetyltransferase complex protein AlgI
LLLVVWFAPNTQQLLAAYRPALALFAESYQSRLNWRPTPVYAVITAAIALLAIFNLHRQSEFLYFQF